MSKELNKRIVTSVLLFLLAIFCIFNKQAFIITIFVSSCIAFSEINKMIYRITRSVYNKKWIIFNILSFFYFFFIFTPLAFGLHMESPTFLLYVLSICICSDIGGYITGRTIGGKKLTKISPNKTISGTIGSFLFSLLPLVFISQNFIKIEFIIIVWVLTISLTCQLGDLFISYLKRLAKVKDTGSFLPEHGGILDRIDGIIFGVPSAFLFWLIIFI